ncbi:hypothetical protein AAC387_Pa02g0067 [Persea americana]
MQTIPATAVQFISMICFLLSILQLNISDIQFSLGISKKSPPPRPNKNKNVKSSGDKYNPQAKGGTKLLKGLPVATRVSQCYSTRCWLQFT